MHTQSQVQDEPLAPVEPQLLDNTDRVEDGRSSLKTKLLHRVESAHGRIPGIKKVPLAAIGIIGFIALVNMFVWAVCGVVLHFYPSLISSAAISYSLGLRHALDADHISAIDLMTRRLLATGQRPVTVGTFFSLGHSTIVIITSVVVAATAAAVSNRFNGFSRVGGIIGTSVSASFLILLGIMNAYILYKLVQQMRKVLNLRDGEEAEAWKIEGGGILFALLKRMFRLIDRPWKMYPLGVMFGLGFDTSSEIALLGISSIQAARGTDFWVILIFPILFTAGMCLLDTADGALMLSLYIQPATNFLPAKRDTQSTASENTPLAGDLQPDLFAPTESEGISDSQNTRDPVAFLYYSIVLTTLTVLVAIVIGVLQLLSLVVNVADVTGPFWDGVQTANDYYDAIGGGICGCFVIVGMLSVVCYKPWRRWVDEHRQAWIDEERVFGESACATSDTPVGNAEGASDVIVEGDFTGREHSGSSVEVRKDGGSTVTTRPRFETD